MLLRDDVERRIDDENEGFEARKVLPWFEEVVEVVALERVLLALIGCCCCCEYCCC